MAHAQKPDFVILRIGRVHLNRRGRQFSRLLAAEGCALVVVMLDTACSEVVWRVLATHSIRQVPLHFPSRASPCAITFQLESTTRPTNPVHKFSFHFLKICFNIIIRSSPRPSAAVCYPQVFKPNLCMHFCSSHRSQPPDFTTLTLFTKGTRSVN